MKDLYEKTVSLKYSVDVPTDNSTRVANSVSLEAGPSSRNFHKPLCGPASWCLFSLCLRIVVRQKVKIECVIRRIMDGWTATVKRMMNSGSMKRIFGLNKTGFLSSRSEIWLLGACYKVLQDDSADPTQSEEFASFLEDFSSRILITYRKGFAPIEDSKYTSDVNWGCMIRSSQMLIAQALLFHLLGRSWRKAMNKPLEQNYIEILHLFGDSESSPYSVHNLLQAGKVYGLSPGSWVGPYAICRTWEALARNRKGTVVGDLTSSISIYVVSGDEDGERGGAPMVCVEDISRHCLEFSRDQADWTPIVLLVPLVLGVDKLNPRYIPLLATAFCFPQSLGILGGRPALSTYIIGMQDDNAFCLDPHEVQPVVDVRRDDMEVDTSSYHSDTIRHFPLDSIDPSLAIGFYCRDKSDFDDFCLRASELANQSNGAPLFTVTQARNSPSSISCQENGYNNAEFPDPESFEGLPAGEREDSPQEDDWQLL